LGGEGSAVVDAVVAAAWLLPGAGDVTANARAAGGGRSAAIHTFIDKLYMYRERDREAENERGLDIKHIYIYTT
jgi:hypothetical protein